MAVLANDMGLQTDYPSFLGRSLLSKCDEVSLEGLDLYYLNRRMIDGS